jgi:hypothetical protein
MHIPKIIVKSLIVVLTLALGASPAAAQTEKETKKWKDCQKKAEKVFDQTKKIEVFKEFIQKNPDSFYVPKARRIVQEPDEFRAAITANTMEAFKAYLAKYPDGPANDRWDIEKRARDIYFKDKTIDVWIRALAAADISGEYLADPSPSPYLEKAILRGGKFGILFVRFENSDNLVVPFLSRSLFRNLLFSVDMKGWSCDATLAMNGVSSVSMQEDQIPGSLPNHGAINYQRECRSNWEGSRTIPSLSAGRPRTSASLIRSTSS